MRTSFISFLILLSMRGAAQSDTRESNEDTIRDCILSIKTPPLSVIDLYSAGYKLGIEYKIAKSTSIYMEGGRYFSGTGFNIRPNIKFYINERSRGFCTGYYIALQYMYKQHAFDMTDSIVMSGSQYKKTFHVSEYVNCIDILFGHTRVGYRNFIFEYFAGAGIRFKNQSDSGITQQELNNDKSDDGDGDSEIDYQERTPGKFTYFDFTAGIKIGWRIK